MWLSLFSELYCIFVFVVSWDDLPFNAEWERTNNLYNCWLLANCIPRTRHGSYVLYVIWPAYQNENMSQMNNNMKFSFKPVVCVMSESVVKTVVKTTKSLGATLNPQVWICAGYVGKNILMDQDPYQDHNLSGYFNLFFCCHNLLVWHTRCLSLTFLLISNIYTGHDLYISFHKLFSSSVICQTPDTTTRENIVPLFWLFRWSFCSGHFNWLDYYCIAYFNTKHIYKITILVWIKKVITWI